MEGVTDVMAGFGAATREWFTAAFAAPTAAQTGAWGSIAAGHNAVVTARDVSSVADLADATPDRVLAVTLDVTDEGQITEAVRQGADGGCSGEKIDLTEAATYTVATNDFTASGGDAYPVLLPRANSREILAAVVTAYIAGNSALSLPGEPLTPQIEGRITRLN